MYLLELELVVLSLDTWAAKTKAQVLLLPQTLTKE